MINLSILLVSLLIIAQQLSGVYGVTQAEMEENERMGAALRTRLETALMATNVSDTYKLFAMTQLGESEELSSVQPQPQPRLTPHESASVRTFSRRIVHIRAESASITSVTTSTNSDIGFLNPCANQTSSEPRRCCRQDTAPVVTGYTSVARYSCTKTRADSYTRRCGRWLRRRRCTSYRTGYTIGQCTRTETRYQHETRCCPNNALTCCLGFVYVQPKTINISNTTSIELEAQCVTVDRFIDILHRLECLVNPAGCEK